MTHHKVIQLHVAVHAVPPCLREHEGMAAQVVQGSRLVIIDVQVVIHTPSRRFQGFVVDAAAYLARVGLQCRQDTI